MIIKKIKRACFFAFLVNIKLSGIELFSNHSLIPGNRSWSNMTSTCGIERKQLKLLLNKFLVQAESFRNSVESDLQYQSRMQLINFLLVSATVVVLAPVLYVNYRQIHYAEEKMRQFTPVSTNVH